MSIVLNEREWAIEKVEQYDLGKKPSETLRRVARMYIDDGLPNDVIRRKLADFIIRCDSGANPFSWSNAIDNAISIASRRESIHIESIGITKREMEIIKGLNGRQIERLAFTLLCIAKYWNAVNENNDGWVNTPDNEIMKMANVSTSIKRQSQMYHTLYELGLIRFSKVVDNTNVKVKFMKNDKVVLSIVDFRNLGNQYLMYIGEPYFRCSNCGIVTKISKNGSKRQKYCKDCAIDVAVQQRINASMRYRSASAAREGSSKSLYSVYMHVSPSGMRYIGTTTTTLEHRWKNGAGYDKNKRFWDDILKYGWGNIKHYVIAQVYSEDLARGIEAYYIEKYDAANPDKGYNRAVPKSSVTFDGNVEDMYPPKLLV